MENTYCPLVNGKCRDDCIFILTKSNTEKIDKKCKLVRAVEGIEYIIDNDILTDQAAQNKD